MSTICSDTIIGITLSEEKERKKERKKANIRSPVLWASMDRGKLFQFKAFLFSHNNVQVIVEESQHQHSRGT